MQTIDINNRVNNVVTNFGLEIDHSSVSAGILGKERPGGHKGNIFGALVSEPCPIRFEQGLRETPTNCLIFKRDRRQ